MSDITPALSEAVTEEFNRRIGNDRAVQNFLKRLEEGKATQGNASFYAQRLGTICYETIIDVLTDDALPDGKLYWNIANNIIPPLIKSVHRMVDDAMVQIITAEHSKLGLGIKAVHTEYPKDRIKAVIQAAVDESIDNELAE